MEGGTMSRRKQRSQERAAAERAGAEPAGGAGSASLRGLAVDVVVLVTVFAVTAAVAELAGAANLGVALGVGQVAFALVLVVLLARR
jgi:hypothetical protein